MARRVPNQAKENNAHYRRSERYVAMLDGAYKKATDEAVSLALLANHSGDTPFKWSDYPQAKAKLDQITRDFANNLKGAIVNGATVEWKESNFKNDKLAKQIIGIKKFDVDASGNKVIPPQFKKYFNNNDKALAQFISRKDKGGMNLSKRVWNLSEQLKADFELSLSDGLSNGKSAAELSRDVRKHLNEPSKLFRRVRDDKGNLRLSNPAKAYHPGTGVYRSSYKNAQRLTRTEINMVYRNADRERWSQMDFVVGFEVKRSGRGYDCSVCSSLAGKYPKDFKFVGWHPSCRCYVIPILKTDDEFWAWDGRGEAPTSSVNEVKDIPQGAKNYIAKNRDRISTAEDRRTLPYWLRDNKQHVKSVLSEMTMAEISKEIAVNPKIITDDIFRRKGGYTDYRQSLHASIIDEYTTGDFSSDGDTIYMLGGATANGKSTLVESGLLPHPKKSLVIDPDSIKAKIPEYRKMLSSGNADLVEKAANFVHEESSFLGKEIRERAFGKDLNVVLDGVNDGLIEKIQKNAAVVRELTGKKIRADYCTLDTDLSIQLAKDRALRTGRTVPLDYINKINRDVSRAFPDIIANNVFDELYLWDTNINGTPRLILQQVNGKLKIEDKNLYQRFLSKGEK